MSVEDDGETNTVRLSHRTTSARLDKLMLIAKAKGWLNAHGRPNISRVLNFIVDRFEMPSKAKKGKGKSHG
jgi:hypothetical protein